MFIALSPVVSLIAGILILIFPRLFEFYRRDPSDYCRGSWVDPQIERL
jgi:hypothetical protein